MTGRRDRLREVVAITRSEVASGLALSQYVGEDGDGSGAYFEELEQETVSKFNKLAQHLQHKEEASANVVEADPVKSDEPSTGYVSSETQFSFTVPPHFSPLFFVRYRTVVDGSTVEPWINPLEYRSGTLFTPKLRIRARSKHSGSPGSKRGEKDFVYRVPPPVVLSKSWEKLNIIQDKLYQEEGNLRVYTISGLTPSLEKGDSWTNWMFSSAGQGLYGRRRLEVQFAECDDLSQGFGDIPERRWRLLPTVTYDIPSVDLITGLLFMTLNWARSVGIKQLEDALLGQFDSNRVVWQNVLKDFASEMTIKLEPVWQKSVYPWLAKDQTLQFLLKDKRDSLFRHNALRAMELLQSLKVIRTIPSKFRQICPRVDKLVVSPINQSESTNNTGITFIPGNDTSSTIRSVAYEVVEGTSFIVNGHARRSVFYESSEELPEGYYLKLWWSCDNETSGHIIDLSSGLIGYANQFVAGHGGKIRRKDLIESSKGATPQDQLTINAAGKHGNLLLEEGTVLSFRLIAEEYGAHEDDMMELKVKIVPKPTHALRRRLSIDSEMNLDTIVDPSQDVIDIPIRRAVPQLIGGRNTDDQVNRVFEKLLKSEETIDLSNEETIGYLLHELGHNPTQLDTQLAAQSILPDGTSAFEGDPALQGRSPILKETEAFLAWYRESTFSESMLQSTMSQFEDTLRERRNHVLQNYLKIPQAEWGFKPNEWGGILPESKLLIKHASGLAKLAMHESWLKRREVEKHDESKEEDVKAVVSRKLVDLSNAEEVEKAEIREVLEVYVRNMIKEQIANSLPRQLFTLEDRNEWVLKHVNADSSFDAVLHEFMVWKVVEYYRNMKRDFDLSSDVKEQRKLEAALRQKKALAFLEEGSSIDNLDANLNLGDLCKEVAKSITREQVKAVTEELVPVLKNEILPSLVQGLGEFVRETIYRNKVFIVGGCAVLFLSIYPGSARLMMSQAAKLSGSQTR